MVSCVRSRSAASVVQWTVICCVVLWIVVGLTSGVRAGPLVDYVALPDDAYRWQIVDEQTDPDGFRLLTIALTSQKWQNITWQHRLMMIVPPELNATETMLMLVSASGTGQTEAMIMKQMAATLGVPTAVLMDTPNQPLFHGLREDALIAYTFLRYVATDNAEWPLLLPMVKGAVRAMDTLESLAVDEFGWGGSQFVVTGASKRGWTTWLTAAVDPRVVGIAPMVYNNLDLAAQMELQGRTFAGGASPKISDYTGIGIHQMISSPAGQALSSIVDPYAYLDDLTIPKLLLHGTNDPYWPVDAVNVYWDDLPGEKYLVNIPNAGHDLDESLRVLQSVGLFFKHVTEQPILPNLSWTADETEGRFILRVPHMAGAKRATLWVAVAPTRDFTHARWSELPAQEEEDGWVARPIVVPRQHLALFMSIEFELASGENVTLDTPIFVLSPR